MLLVVLTSLSAKLYIETLKSSQLLSRCVRQILTTDLSMSRLDKSNQLYQSRHGSIQKSSLYNLKMASEIIEQINELINDRNQLKKDSASETIKKLVDKRDQLKQSFILNLPFNYSNEAEFSDLFQRVGLINVSIRCLKNEKEAIASRLRETASREDSKSNVESDLEPRVLKSLQIKRHMAYLRCLIKVEELKQEIELNIESLTRMQAEESTQRLKVKDQKLDKRMIEKLDQLERTRSLDQQTLLAATIILYKELRQLLETIMSTQCLNLIIYISDSLQAYHTQLSGFLINKIEDKLKSISYPFITGDDKLKEKQDLSEGHEHQVQSRLENEKSILKECVEFLLDIELMPMLVELSKNENLKIKFEPLVGGDKSLNNNKITLVRILVKPFETRFKFHFMGTRKTNNYEKPEWYLSQVLKWLRGHEEFLNMFIQPIFEKYKLYKKQPVIIDFTNFLLDLIKKKINVDLDNLIKNKFQFSHTVDELLLFDAQLKSELKEFMLYDGRFFSGSLQILCQNEHLFTNWINLERHVCQKKLDMMFISSPIGNLEETGSLNLLNADRRSSDVWCCDYSDVDKMKPPHCAESFMSMIKAITDRFSELPYQSKKLKFVSLQVELINDFHLRICQIVRDEAKSPFGKTYLGALNAVNYVINILDEWKNSTFYIEVHYLKMRYSQFINKQKSIKLNRQTTSSVSRFDLLGASSQHEKDHLIESDLQDENELSRKFDEQFLEGESLFHNFHSMIDVDGTLFDSVLSSYEKIKDEMLLTVINNCLWEIKTRSRDYRREKWISMPLLTDYYKVTLSQSAADMLISLKNLIFLLKDSLAQVLFETILKRLTAEIDRFLFDEIILKNQFNDGGILQFDHDFTKYFLPILNEFTVDSKNESFLRKTKEALILLKLKKGSALLATEIIYNALHSDITPEAKKAAIYNAKSALKEFGIVLLNCDIAEEILKLRLY